MTLLISTGIAIVVLGCAFLALQLITRTPLDRGYAHAIAMIGGGLVAMQGAWLLSENPIYFLGAILGIPLCALVAFVAYTQDRGHLKRQRARRGRRLANARIKSLLRE